MKARLSLLAALAVIGALLVAPTAQAQSSPQPLDKKLALTGKTPSGKSFKGSYSIDRFTRARKGRYAGQLVAVGTVVGRSGGKRYVKNGVVMPAKVGAASTAAQLPNIPGACQILNLTLAPIDLNLLGLRVRTSRIDVRIDAIPGGGLLGDLLCGLNNLLGGGGLTPGQAARVLNAILALLGL